MLSGLVRGRNHSRFNSYHGVMYRLVASDTCAPVSNNHGEPQSDEESVSGAKRRESVSGGGTKTETVQSSWESGPAVVRAAPEGAVWK
jgi:hypothetical protein